MSALSTCWIFTVVALRELLLWPNLHHVVNLMFTWTSVFCGFCPVQLFRNGKMWWKERKFESRKAGFKTWPIHGVDNPNAVIDGELLNVGRNKNITVSELGCKGIFSYLGFSFCFCFPRQMIAFVLCYPPVFHRCSTWANSNSNITTQKLTIDREAVKIYQLHYIKETKKNQINLARL